MREAKVRNREKKGKWRIPVIVLTGLLALSLFAGGVLAYMTKRDGLINTFTVGDVHIKAWEPSFPTEDEDGNGVPDECELVIPYETILKDPRIKNAGNNDAVVFFKVTSPVEMVNLILDDGTRPGKQEADLFWFKQKDDPEDLHENNFNENWVELKGIDNKIVECASCNNEGRGYTYIFGYHVRMSPGDITEALFDKVQNKRYGSETIKADEIEQIRVEAYAVQADDIMKEGILVDTGSELPEETLAYIYQAFCNQNTEALSGRHE